MLLAAHTSVRTLSLAELREQVCAVQARGETLLPGVPTGWDSIDSVLPGGGLTRHAVHEWIGLEPLGSSGMSHGARTAAGAWIVPMGVLVHLARQAALTARRAGEPIAVCWIGRRVWPTVFALARDHLHQHDQHDQREPERMPDLAACSLLVDADDARARLWAIDHAARSAQVLVIADGSGLDMASTRRLQLAAEAGGWMVHLARPPGELKVLSAASTRWRVAQMLSPDAHPHYAVSLLRSKGCRSGFAQDRTFTLQRDTRDRLVCVSPASGERPGQAERAG